MSGLETRAKVWFAGAASATVYCAEEPLEENVGKHCYFLFLPAAIVLRQFFYIN